ncbi:hypothetical protein [Acidimangrovimonas sediminis]|uniref:hypothetical protein n=1 Tax=Acidimangrovimonas sediminis TaxID=2056283 RepID=UPI00130501A2|nr:hypothetical protein [Acidimangrovimonas sediminis]
MSDREVWGFTITTNSAGKNIWPNALKREAVRRMVEDGEAPGDIAAELGAHECLVRKWGVAARRARGERISVAEPAFAEISVGDTPKAPQTSAAAGATVGRLHIGALSLEFPLDIAEADLLKLIRVAGHAS